MSGTERRRSRGSTRRHVARFKIRPLWVSRFEPLGDRHVQKVEETASSLALFVVATKRGALHRPAMADATVVDLITKLMEEELDKSTDREDRIKAVKRLPDVTAALGIEKTLEMLIPLLDRKITEDVDEDEMMLAVSGLLGKLVPAVGGAANAMVLFEPLLKLSKVEETLVRESATRSIIAVTDVIVHPTEAQAKMASDGLTSMYSDTECFFSKLSACAITPPVYRICRAAGSPEEQLKEMRSTFAEAVVDETPMIRRAAAAAIGELALAIADPALICSDVLPMLDKLYHEETEQDTVRVLAVKQVPLLIGPRLLTHPAAADASEPSAESIAIVEKCLGIIKAAAVDVSWRVRDATSKCFPEVSVRAGRDRDRGRVGVATRKEAGGRERGERKLAGDHAGQKVPRRRPLTCPPLPPPPRLGPSLPLSRSLRRVFESW